MNKIYITMMSMALASTAFTQTVLFDQESAIVPVTGAYGQFTDTYGIASSAADNYNQASENINLGSSGATINGIDFLYTTGSGITATDDLSVQVQIYQTFTNKTTGSGAEYSNLLSTTTIDLGTGFAGGYIYGSTADFNAGGSAFLGPNDNYALNSTKVTGGSVGVVFTFLDNGVKTENAGIALDEGLADVVGSNAVAGTTPSIFAANDEAATHGITGSEYQNLGVSPTSDLTFTLYGAPAAPEPVSMTFLGLGVAGLIARRRRSPRS